MFAIDTIINNAFNAMEDVGGKVHVATRKLDENRMSIEISDSGGGVSEDHLAFLFNWPEPDITGGPNIHGVGLPMSRELLSEIGGSISVSNVESGLLVAIEIPYISHSNGS